MKMYRPQTHGFKVWFGRFCQNLIVGILILTILPNSICNPIQPGDDESVEDTVISSLDLGICNRETLLKVIDTIWQNFELNRDFMSKVAVPINIASSDDDQKYDEAFFHGIWSLIRNIITATTLTIELLPDESLNDPEGMAAWESFKNHGAVKDLFEKRDSSYPISRIFNIFKICFSAPSSSGENIDSLSFQELRPKVVVAEVKLSDSAWEPLKAVIELIVNLSPKDEFLLTSFDMIRDFYRDQRTLMFTKLTDLTEQEYRQEMSLLKVIQRRTSDDETYSAPSRNIEHKFDQVSSQQVDSRVQFEEKHQSKGLYNSLAV